MKRLSQQIQLLEQQYNKEEKKTKPSQFFFENQRFQKTFSDVQKIGEGSFGRVFKAKHKLENHYYAIKKIKLKIRKKDDPRKHKVFREVVTMINCYHPNVVRFVTCWFEEEKENENVKTDGHLQIVFSQSQKENRDTSIEKVKKVKVFLYIQMELCQGQTIRHYLYQDKVFLDEKMAFYIFNQLIDGLDYLSHKNIVHRDIKPQNIFLSKGVVKIGDFGLATVNKKISRRHRVTQLINEKTLDVGSPLYIAPEVERDSYYSEKTDVFSLGMVMFEILSQFKTLSQKIKTFSELRKQYKIPEEFKQKYLCQSELIQRMIEPDLEKRISIQDIRNTIFYKEWEKEVEISLEQLIYNEHKNRLSLSPITLQREKRKQLPKLTQFRSLLLKNKSSNFVWKTRKLERQ